MHIDFRMYSIKNYGLNSFKQKSYLNFYIQIASLNYRLL